MNESLLYFLLVFAANALGGLSRFALSDWVARRFAGPFPLGTLAVNISGSFLIGWVWVQLPPSIPRDLAITGFLGGYTTVSSFTLASLTLFQNGQGLLAALNIAGTVLLSLVAVITGTAAAHLIALV